MKVIILLIFTILIMLILTPWVISLFDSYFEWSIEKFDEIKEKMHKDE